MPYKTLDHAPPGSRAGHLAAQIEAAVETGELAPGVLLPPLPEMASAAGTSVATVAVALHSLSRRGVLVGRKAGTVVAPVVGWRPEPVPPSQRGPNGKTADVAAKIRAAIDHGHYTPGRPLGVRALGRQYGCTHPTVIRALRALAADGLVERHGEGNRTRWRVHPDLPHLPI